MIGNWMALAVLSLFSGSRAQEAEPPQGQWLNWRGPGNCGAATGCRPPLAWSSDRNVRWRAPVPGRGAATPIVLSDRVVLLTAVETDEERAPAPAKPLRQRNNQGDRPPRPPPSFVHDFFVLCYSRADGSLLWSTKVNSELPHEGHHRHGSYAAGSAVSDGKRIYAYFNSYGLYALDLDGEVLWEQDFGHLTYDRGEGASAALHGNTLILQRDHRGPSEVIAVDTDSGDVRWRKERDEGANRSTPAIAEIGERPQAVLYGRTACGYDLETGEVLWSVETPSAGSIASPIVADGMAFLYAANGRSKFFAALNLTEASGDQVPVLWSEGRQIPQIASPAYHDGVLYAIKGDSTQLSAYDARTGTVLAGPQRLELGTIYSSVVVAKGRLYITDREGVTLVLRREEGEFKVLRRNELGEEAASSMALADDQIFLRGSQHLYCLANSADS